MDSSDTVQTAFQSLLNHLVNVRMSFTYVNYAGEIEPRNVIVKSVFFGVKLPYYPEPEWLIDAVDLDRNALRTFAIRRIYPDSESAERAYPQTVING